MGREKYCKESVGDKMGENEKGGSARERVGVWRRRGER